MTMIVKDKKLEPAIVCEKVLPYTYDEALCWATKGCLIKRNSWHRGVYLEIRNNILSKVCDGNVSFYIPTEADSTAEDWILLLRETNREVDNGKAFDGSKNETTLNDGGKALSVL